MKSVLVLQHKLEIIEIIIGIVNLLMNIEPITKIAKWKWNYESHYRYPMMVSELLKWTTFVLFLSLSKLWRHCYFIKISILYILGFFPTSPSLWHPFWMIPYRKIIAKYRNISLLNWYGYCAIDMKMLETKCYCKIDLEILNFILILQNLLCNIEIISAIVGIIWNYWSHYDIPKFIWKYRYPYWYWRKPLIILKLVLMF